MCVSKLVFSQRYLPELRPETSRVWRVLPGVSVLVRLAIGPDTPRPIFSPSCSVTVMMLILLRNSDDSCILVSSFCCTDGSTEKVEATFVVSFSCAMRAEYCSRAMRVFFFMSRAPNDDSLIWKFVTARRIRNLSAPRQRRRRQAGGACCSCQ